MAAASGSARPEAEKTANSREKLKLSRNVANPDRIASR